VVHDAEGSREHKVSEASGGQHVLHPLLHLTRLHVEAGGDDTALVDAADELHHDLASAMVVKDLEITNITILLHDLQELNHHLRRRADHNLSLSALLGVGDGLQAIRKGRHSSHL